MGKHENKIDKAVVFICDRVYTRDNVDIASTDLEFTSPTYYNTMMNALNKISNKIYHYNSPKEFIDNITLHKDDVVLAAIWSGVHSRNRKSMIASICEAYDICYLGADAFVQSFSQDKDLSKLFCSKFKIGIPKGILINNKAELSKNHNLSFPLIVKPNSEGSSIGISDSNIVKNHEELESVVNATISMYAPLLIEEYISGQEIAFCIAGVNGKIDICEAVELSIDGKTHFESEVWGFESKKCRKYDISRKVITEEIDNSIVDEMKNIFTSLGKVDYMRIDGRLRDNQFYLIELTPDCSLHPDCFMPLAFNHNNLDYSEMMRLLINNAIESYTISH